MKIQAIHLAAQTGAIPAYKIKKTHQMSHVKSSGKVKSYPYRLVVFRTVRDVSHWDYVSFALHQVVSQLDKSLEKLVPRRLCNVLGIMFNYNYLIN